MIKHHEKNEKIDDSEEKKRNRSQFLGMGAENIDKSTFYWLILKLFGTPLIIALVLFFYYRFTILGLIAFYIGVFAANILIPMVICFMVASLGWPLEKNTLKKWNMLWYHPDFMSKWWEKKMKTN